MAQWLAEYGEGMWEAYILNLEEQIASVNNVKKKILEMLKGNMGSRKGLWKQKQACACWWDWSMREKQSLDTGERNWLHPEAFMHNWILNLWLEGIYERGGTEDVHFTLFIIVSTRVHLSLLWSQMRLIYNINAASVFGGFILFPKTHWLIPLIIKWYNQQVNLLSHSLSKGVDQLLYDRYCDKLSGRNMEDTSTDACSQGGGLDLLE